MNWTYVYIKFSSSDRDIFFSSLTLSVSLESDDFSKGSNEIEQF